MVSSRNMFQAVMVLVGSVSVVSANAAPSLPEYPSMARIPSQAKHMEVLRARSSNTVDISVLVEATCMDPVQVIQLHDETAAQLSICGGIPGAIQECKGSLAHTVGQHGTARFEVSAVDEGATITLTKTDWIQCVHAARTACPDGSLSAVCLGGASTGDVVFTLKNPQGTQVEL